MTAKTEQMVAEAIDRLADVLGSLQVHLAAVPQASLPTTEPEVEPEVGPEPKVKAIDPKILQKALKSAISAGYKAEAKMVLDDSGAGRLSEVEPKHQQEVLEKLLALADRVDDDDDLIG